MRNPNGYGSIKKLSGNRRRPYVFVVSEGGMRRAVGYYATHEAALIAQTDYNLHRGHPRLSDKEITFAELYYRWRPNVLCDVPARVDVKREGRIEILNAGKSRERRLTSNRKINEIIRISSIQHAITAK